MRNRFAGTCTTCGTAVPAESGVVLREDGRWRCYCSGHEPRPTPPPRGDHPGWHTGPIVGYDCETSSNDPREAFLVSAALVDSSGTSRTWLVDPGDREIPPDAVEIHGISTEFARAEGVPAEEALGEVADAIAARLTAGTAIAIFNAPFDLGVLAAELWRHDLKPLAERMAGPPRPIVDPLVIDRGIDRYRRGPRNLGAMCEFYGVALADAHTARGDAAACLELAREIGARHPDLAGLSLSELHEHQVQWALDYARGRQRWLDENRPGHGRVIDGAWPISA
ncbi:exonuclease domain-containing protein [Halostreptopolyspora alba]|uniref:DNA polymerase III subunit epsilon n=1 Tax=Halostreptopolyspora alba TaxID=2487137 RepID=A0A3N0DYM1_9ACTN|nr:DNA polymerase III subunit epsilon [Nocardiopsaceae bacterium YIM 96095]